MVKLKCCLNIYSKSRHIRQIVTGFMMLEKQGFVQLEINYQPNQINKVPFSSIVEVKLNDSINAVYDLLDGYNFDFARVNNYLENIDFYFKRSFSSEENNKLNYPEKIHPLGLNYNVTMKNNVMDKEEMFLNPLRKFKLHVKEFFGLTFHSNFYVEKFEELPIYNVSEPIVLFSTRTWDPSGEKGENFITDELKDERNYINKTRAECIRGLRKEYGENFIGGLVPTPYAKKYYSDCVLDESITRRVNYLKLIKKADICIATTGLHKSIGWKLGEYVAASKAIVSEKLNYTIPGSFRDQQNYLAFNGVKDCIEKTMILVNDEELTYKLKVNNFMYYQNYVRPDQLVLTSLITTLKNTL